MFVQNKTCRIFVIIFLLCLTHLFAQPLKLNGKADPMDSYGLSTENLFSSKTRETVDSLNCTLVGGWFRGPSYAVFIVDTIAYLGVNQCMKILNVKDSTDPILLGEVRFSSGIVYDIFIKNTLAYVADVLFGLRIIDVSDPSSPEEIGFCETPGWPWSLWVQDSFAYIVDVDYFDNDDCGLRIIDVSDPSNPIMVDSYNGPWGYAFTDVWVQDTIAYVAGGIGLRIINVSDPLSPDSISVFNDTLSFRRLYVLDTLVYAAGFTSGLRIINVSDPSLPVEVGSYDLNIDFPYNKGEIGEIYVQDSLAYIAVFSMLGDSDLDSCGLYIVDVSDPASMNEVGNYLTGGGRAYDVWLQDNLAYVSCANDFDDPEGLIIIDVSEPSSTIEIGEYDTGSQILKVRVKDSFAYVVNAGRGLNIINVSDPSAPYEVGFCGTPSVYGPGDVWVQDTFAYVADDDSGLCIINIASPSLPEEIGIYNTLGEALGVYVQDTLAYVACDTGLSIINVSDPSSPEEIGFYETPSWPSGLWVQDTLAYVTADSLHIINVSNPSSPTEVTSIPGWWFGEIFIKDTIAYICHSYGGGLHIINISEPSTPYEIGFCYTAGEYTRGVWVKDNLAYVTSDTSGLRIIDVSDPSSPAEVGFYNVFDDYATPRPLDVYVQDSLIYLAYLDGGLYIFKYTGTGGIEELTTERDEFNISKISNTIDINYSVVGEKEKVKIEIYNILGQKVACPVDGVQTRGSYTLNWYGKTGIYFVRMEIGGEAHKQKTLLLR
jgi:hypothetical protein